MAEPVIFKGRSDHLEVTLTPGFGFEAIKRALRKKIEANRQFFQGGSAKVSIDGEDLSETERRELAGMLEGDYAISLDFSPCASEDIQPVAKAHESEDEMPQSAKSMKLRKSPSTLFVQETLRSGRRIAFDGDVVVLGDVNNGAEVVASGSIIIMGVLRGLAHAGAQGEETAIISAFSMKARQFRIAAHIAISPDGETESGLPEVARVSGDAIEIIPYRIKY